MWDFSSKLKDLAPFFDAHTRWAEGFFARVCASKKWQLQQAQQAMADKLKSQLLDVSPLKMLGGGADQWKLPYYRWGGAYGRYDQIRNLGFYMISMGLVGYPNLVA